ncbi:E3 SUMO-protein ligase NSE2 [Ixodes scapularis]|uniref:E3 SUMO-protein ligase NSE2 n=1 Tax=Ixodes scapularis TaxID=6945 RepID=UPI00116161D7|nr:E3 SUMO-protein ligase NSE2 [Ixodes scapularis]
MTSFAALDMSVDDIKRLKCNIAQGMDAIRSVATDVLEVCESDEARKNLELLKEHMKALIKEEHDAASYVEAADTLKQQARRQNVAPDKMKDVLDTAYEASRARQPNPEHHVAFKGLLNMVPLVEEGGSNEDSANDDSMLVSEENLQWKDPITQCDIEHPVKNTVCGHIYDKNSIAHYIKTTKHPRCPYLGCRNPRSLRSTELVDDLYVMRFLKERAASK